MPKFVLSSSVKGDAALLRWIALAPPTIPNEAVDEYLRSGVGVLSSLEARSIVADEKCEKRKEEEEEIAKMVELLVWLAYPILHNPELRLASYNAFRKGDHNDKGRGWAAHGFFKVKVGISMVQSFVTSLDSSPIYDGAKDYTGQRYQLRMERMGLVRQSSFFGQLI
ncbi:hypothetical protein PPACK8108_LOCUS7045 [Phakopsora pachyrhizi]|uniref:Uncharacterized protein n=1 Tax=Phakopsora pachyrhizi TaxID=170000 RepID=A0AAV0AS33_PHAPC|nr:hypothetical protein PPACK8108_LOCUS7045 [Phakopsora pachyrhizi]